MKFNPKIHHRKTHRLQNYDYSSEWLYFLTIAVKDKLCLFGEIKDDELELFESGKMIEKLWLELENDFENIKLHDYVVMPNHFHGIVEIVKTELDELNRVNTRFTPTGGKFNYNKNSISSIIQAFKSKTTHQYIKIVYENKTNPFYKKLWQKDFYEHIIKNEDWYLKIVEYIKNNPIKWEEDKFYYTEI